MYTFDEFMKIRNTIRRLRDEVFQDGVEYAHIGRGDRPTLLQPGAQALAQLMELTPHFEVVSQHLDWEKKLFHFLVRCDLYSAEGQLVARGFGEANTNGYRYQRMAVADAVNTVLKMAQKRAFVGTVSFVAGVAGLFTQDLEDFETVPDNTNTAPRDNLREEWDFEAAYKWAEGQGISRQELEQKVLGGMTLEQFARQSPDVTGTKKLFRQLVNKAVAERERTAAQVRELQDVPENAPMMADADKLPDFPEEEQVALFIDALAKRTFPWDDAWRERPLNALAKATQKKDGSHVYQRAMYARLKELGLDGKEAKWAVQEVKKALGVEHLADANETCFSVWKRLVAYAPDVEEFREG